MKWLEKLVHESQYAAGWPQLIDFHAGVEWMAAQIKEKDSCLGNIEEGEPIFVLRAQDELAPDVVAYWLEAWLVLAADAIDLDEKRQAKVQHVTDTILAMRTWSPRRMPD